MFLLFVTRYWLHILVGLLAAAFIYSVTSTYSENKRLHAQIHATQLQVEQKQQEIESLQGGIAKQNEGIRELQSQLEAMQTQVEEAQKAAHAIPARIRKQLAANSTSPEKAEGALDWAVTRGKQLSRVWEMEAPN